MLGKCKRFLSLLCAIVIVVGTYGAYLIPLQSLVSAAETEILDLDDDVKYFGRTFYEYDASGNKIYKFSWANSGFQFSFKGKGAEITLYGYSSDEKGTVSRLWPRVKVYINGELATNVTSNIKLNGSAVSADSIVSLNSANENTESSTNKNTLTISGLKEGNWTVKIVKCSDSYYNGFGLGQIQLRNEGNITGKILETQKYYDRQMLFIGDSLVTGLGNLVSSGQYGRNDEDTGVGNQYSAQQEDTTLSFTSIAADAFGAENMTVANHSVGLVKNLVGGTANLAKDFFEYNNFYKRFNKRSEVYDHTQYDPDIIVISLGLGDDKNGVSTSDYNAACKDFIMQVHTSYPNAKILYAYEKGSKFASQIEAVIKDLKAVGYNEFFCVPLTAFAAEDLITVPSNYNYANGRFLKAAAHEVRAKELIRAVEDVTDWKSSISVSNPVSDDMPADTIYGPVEDTDVSLLSYNVMQNNSSGQTYLDPSKRAPLAVKFIKSYMPDIICLQEASTVSGVLNIDGYGATNWATYLTAELEKVGYECLLLTETVTNNDGTKKDGSNYTLKNMDIGRGLIICWKANRFTSDGSGRTRFVPDDFGDAQEQDRYWQWVDLKENTGNPNAVFRVYNTHIYTYPGAPTETAKDDAHLVSEKMMEALASEINSDMANKPVVLAGDFTKIYDDSNKSEVVAEKKYSYLYNFENISWMENAVRTAYYTRLADPDTTPNNIFYNKKYIDMREAYEIYDGYEGRTLTSQEPIIAYFNFRCAVSFDSGFLSNDKTIFTDTANSGTYTLQLTIPSGVVCGVFYEEDGSRAADNVVGDDELHTITLTLKNKENNRFVIRCNYGTAANSSTRLNFISLNITRTDSTITNARPNVWATNTVNSYFANGAYHLLAGRHILRVSANNGELYWNPYATKPVTSFNLDLKQGRTVLYVKSSATGDVYPVYIYRQTHTQAIDKISESTIYVDDDFPAESSGKVAFYDGERVIFVDSNSDPKKSRAFSTVAGAAAKANGDGLLTTIYFGSGNYDLNQKHNTNIIKFTDDVILLGSNYDISAVDPQANHWYVAGRKPESIINGGFYFQKQGNISVTVKGFKFQGQSGDGTIRLYGSTDVNDVQTVDIQNNIFMGAIDVTNKDTGRAVIWADSQARVTGLIKDNYFRCVQDNTKRRNTSLGNSDYRYNTIAAYFVGLKDLLIEHNCFVGYEICLNIRDVNDNDDFSLSTSFTVYANRFDNCGANLNYLYGVGENDKTYICYRSNDFVRCGSGGDTVKHAIDLYFNESKILPGKVFENITVDVTGNRFMDCEHTLRLNRANATAKPNTYHALTDMTFNFTKNSIINPLERHYKDEYFYSIAIQGYPNVNGDGKIVSAQAAADSDKWDFSGNYCYTPFFDKESNYYESITETDTGNMFYSYGLYDVRKYIRNTTTGTNSTVSVTISDEVLESEIRAYDRAYKAFEGAVGSYEEGWKYDFDHIQLPDTFDKSVEIGYDYDYISDIADMDFLRGVTPLRDKMTALDASVTSKELKKIDNHSMLTTEHFTGEMRGLTSFYSDVRWYCRNRVSFDIRTTYTGNEATFFYKYSNGALDGKTISNEQFYTKTNTDGITLNFKTDANGKPTIEMRVYKIDGTFEPFVFTSDSYNITDMTEFNHIDIIEKEIGTMDFYVNGKRFAQVVGQKDDSYTFTSGSIASETNTSNNAFYTSLQVSRVTQDTSGNDVVQNPVTVSDTSVTKQSAIAFSSSDASAASTADDLWPAKKSMEIDVLEVVDLGVSKLTIINDIAAGILYKAWNMTDCVYDDETKTYTYTINKDWIEFFTQKIDVNNSDLWEIGTLGTNGENTNSRSDRLRTKTYISTDIEEITVAEGYQYIPVCYNPDGSFMGYYDVNTSALSGSVGKWTTETADVEAIRKQLGENVGIRLLFNKIDDNSTHSLDLSQNLEFICFELREFFTQKIDVNNSDLWESGTIGKYGENVPGRSDRLRTKTYISTDIEEITVAEGYQYIPVCYNPDGSFMGYYNVNTSALSGSDGIWTTETADVEAIRKQLGENVGIRLLFSKPDNSTLSLDLSQNLEFICSEPIEGTEELISRLFRTTVLDDGRILLTFDRGGDSNPVEHDNEDMVQLAKVAVAYALEKGIQPVGIKKSVPKSDEPGKYEAVMPIDGPGYYLVNSTLGSLITTDTYDNKDGTFNLTVYEKNDPPMIDKYVLEDSDQNWKKFNDTSIGEETQFKLLVTVQDGAFNYTIRDLYSEHFDNIAITSVKQYSSYDPASNSNPLVATFVNDTHYTVSDDKSNNVLTIKFASSDAADNTVGSLEEVPSGNVIEVIYTAKVLPSAPSEEAIQTSATLSYGRIDTDVNLDPDLRVTEQFVTEKTSVNTYLWSVNLFKYTEEEGVKKALSGAEFALCTDQAGSKKLSFIGSAGNYRVAASGEAGATTKLVDDGNGNYTISGLDGGIYYVVEIAAPSGYSRMSSPEPINIAVQNQGVGLVRTNTYTYDVNGDGMKDAFAFVNKAGFSLPSTGAAGRRMFIATGSVIVLSMSILLVTRMRSSKIVFTKSKVTFKKR